MPELPEVETTVRSLEQKVQGRTFVDFWTDFPKNIKKPKSLSKFEKAIKNKKILGMGRKAKNILFFLSDDKTLLVHQKMTGHLLLGKWKEIKGEWISQISGPLFSDPRNRFIHLILFLDDKNQIALSDMRKFSKIELWENSDLKKSKEFNALGPDPLSKDFTFKIFKKIIPERGKIKQVLMNQTIISGIGNIYSDEILWEARIHPLRDAGKLKDDELKNIYFAIAKVLKEALIAKGDSFSDYRLISGEVGGYQKIQKAYGRQKLACLRGDGGIIQRLKIGGRSAHFCPICQK
jgi:formamidopyrimidine-DNA glycosylase